MNRSSFVTHHAGGLGAGIMHETRAQGKTDPEGMRDAIVETRPDDVNRLIRPEWKLPMSGHPAF